MDVEGPSVVLDYVHEVSLVRVLGTAVIPARLAIKAEIMPLDEIDTVDLEIICAKLKFWFDSILHRCIAVCRFNSEGMALFTTPDGRMQAANTMMLTPYEPTDEHLATLLQAKIGALSDENLMVGYVRVTSQEKSGLVATYVGSWMDDLPTMAEWFPTKPYYFDSPWWARGDISMVDLVPVGGEPADFTVRPRWAGSLDFIERAMRLAPDEQPESGSVGVATEEESVIWGKFRPRVIDGDAQDR